MDNAEMVRTILLSPDWTEAEKGVVKWQFRLLGGFKTALWDTITKADDDNLESLRRGFPTEVEGYEMWTRGDLASRLRQAGLVI
jgi:hypothetical protein